MPSSRNRYAMNHRVRLRWYDGFPAASQLFTWIAMTGVFASVILCAVAKQTSIGFWVLVGAFALAITFAIVSDRVNKKREERFIAAVVEEAKRKH